MVEFGNFLILVRTEYGAVLECGTGWWGIQYGTEFGTKEPI